MHTRLRIVKMNKGTAFPPKEHNWLKHFQCNTECYCVLLQHVSRRYQEGTLARIKKVL